MSKVFNMVSGGGGKNISSIVITGLSSTDTVTCTKDGKSYTATWDATAQHWEIVGLPLGTFSLTATNGAKSTTATVQIDVTGVYEIEMSFKLWLYKDGDECEAVTGGWSNSGYSRANWSVAAGVKNSDNMLVGQDPGVDHQYRMFGTVNAIDCSVYHTLKIQLKPFKIYTLYDQCLEIWTNTSKAFYPSEGLYYEITGKSIGTTYEIALPYSLSGQRYIAVCGDGVGDGQYGSYVYKVWLE